MIWLIIFGSLLLLGFIIIALFLYAFGKIASGDYRESYTPEQIEDIKKQLAKGDKDHATTNTK